MESNHFAGGAYAMNPPLATLPPLHHCRYYFLSDFIVARQPQALMSCINIKYQFYFASFGIAFPTHSCHILTTTPKGSNYVIGGSLN